MNNQVFYEDVVEGQELPPFEKLVTTVNILMYLSTVWLMDRIHFDHPFATQRRGLPNVVAPGNMAGDYYTQFLTEWAGEKGTCANCLFNSAASCSLAIHLPAGVRLLGNILRKEKVVWNWNFR